MTNPDEPTPAPAPDLQVTDTRSSQQPELPQETGPVAVPDLPVPADDVPPGTQPAGPPIEEPRFLTEEELQNFKVIDIFGNCDPQSTLIVDSHQGIPITMVTSITLIFATKPIAAKLEVATGYQDVEPNAQGRRPLKTTTIVAAVGRMMLCTNPRLVRMKQRGSAEWSLIAQFIDRLGNADNTYYAVMEQLRRLRNLQGSLPTAAPEEPHEQADPSSETQSPS